MGAKLNQSLIYGTQSNVFYEPYFSQILDSHIQWLRTAGYTDVRHIDNKRLGQYIGDFYAALVDMGVEARFHRVVMLLNGLTNPIQYRGQFTSIFLPDFDKIDQLESVFGTARRKLAIDTPGN